MRVSTKALAPLPFLAPLLLASCASVSSPRAVPREASVAVPVAASAPTARSPQRGNYDHVRPPHEEGQYSPDKSGRVSFLLGRRELDEAFEPADDLGVFGVEFSTVRQNSPIGFEFGFQFGHDEADDEFVPGVGTADLEVSQGELYAGMRAELTDGPVRPYVGGGGTYVRTETTIDIGGLEASEDDGDFGFYAHGGVQLDITESFFVGLDYRRTFDTEYSIAGEEFDADYGQLTFMLGLSF